MITDFPKLRKGASDFFYIARSERAAGEERADGPAGEKGSLSKGGMDSKLRAVKAAVASGIDTYIANGRKTVLAPLLAGKSVGTFFPGSAL